MVLAQNNAEKEHFETILSVEDLETTFHTRNGPVKALSSVSYSVGKKETVGIVGESGSGKSVSSLCVMGLLGHPGRISGGKILFKGQDLTTLNDVEYSKLRGRKIAMIFQEPMTALNPVLTIGYQMDELLFQHEKLDRKEARCRSIEMLKSVGIPSPEKRYASYIHQLSGGMRQRVMIAMALLCHPELLIADEPTTALDVTIQGQVIDLIQEVQERMGMAVQFITHDLGVISEISDRVVVMYAGKVCEIALADELFANPKHPYTRLLMESLPRRGTPRGELRTIEGSVPSLLNRPRGCPFQNRCPEARAQCSQWEPELVHKGHNHLVACHEAK